MIELPLYEYECPKDGTFELVRKFSDPPLAACPTCGGPIEKLASAPAIQFKGTGWYITDYARKSTGGEGGKRGEGGKSDEGGRGGEGGKDSKDKGASKESSKESSSSPSSESKRSSSEAKTTSSSGEKK